MYISVAEHEKRNGSIAGSVLPIYTSPGPVQVRTWTFPQVDPHRTGKWTTSYRFQEVPCERKAYLDPIWDRSQIYPVPCKRGLRLHMITTALKLTFIHVTYSPELNFDIRKHVDLTSKRLVSSQRFTSHRPLLLDQSNYVSETW